MVKAVIFDMDGVLIDSEWFYFQFEKKFFGQYHIEVTEELFASMLGRSEKDAAIIYEEFCKKENPGMAFESAWKACRQKYSELCLDYSTIVKPNVKRLASWLRDNGYQTAIASSSSMENIQKVLADCKLADCFDVVVSGTDFKQSKPDPEIYLYTMKQLDAAPEECMVVEDSPSGILAAKRAGIYTVAVTEKRFSTDQSQADCFIEDLWEIKDVLRERSLRQE